MTHKTISMGRIDYINASPVYYGLDNGLLPDWITMVDGPPAVLNAMVKDGRLQISPISSAFYGMNHTDLLVLPDLSISCDGKVLSVILVGNYPLEELDGKQLVLTEDSATAAALLKLIVKQKNIRPGFSTKKIHSPGDLPDACDGALIIGDAAMTQPWESVFKYRIDLGELWHQMTGLPFVFALWVVRRSFAETEPGKVQKILDLFHESRAMGYANINRIIRSGGQKLGLSESYVRRYYDCLHCDLDPEKIRGLELFFSSLYEQELFPDLVKPEFFLWSGTI